MATDTSKITGAADELSAGLAKGGTAAKTLGAEIANAIKSLDNRVATLEAGNVNPPDPPIPPDTGGPTGGKVTNFNGNQGGGCKIDGRDWTNHTAGKSYGLQNPDEYTIRFEVHNGDHTWSNDSDCALVGVLGRWRNNTDITIAFRMMVEAGPPNKANWLVIGEVGSLTSVAASPTVALEMQGDKFSIVTRTCRAGGNPSNSSPDLVYKRQWTQPNNLVRGQWYVFELAMRLNQNGGYVRVKLDGQEIVNVNGMTGYGVDTYWNHGMYRQSTADVIAGRVKNLTLNPLI
jgi:Polysaccharide lyase